VGGGDAARAVDGEVDLEVPVASDAGVVDADEVRKGVDAVARSEEPVVAELREDGGKGERRASGGSA
jgi:hypothetical protein